MLSRRLQLPQSLTRRRQWQFQAKLQSRLLSRTRPLPATRGEAAQSSQTEKAASSSPATFKGLFSPNTESSKFESQRPANPGLKRRPSGGPGGSEYLGSSFVSLKRRDPHGGPFSQPKKPSSPSSSSSSLLSDEFASWIDGPNAHAALRKEKEGIGGGNGRVLVLESASRYLAESDFYRLASQGQHVDGWVHGITKVIQARSPITLQPQGKYFLFFNKPASAQAYLQKVLDLHAKVRRIAAKGLVESSEEKEVEVAPDADVDVDIPALLKEYTLLPPGASLKINRPSEEKIREVLLRQQQQQQQPNQRTSTKQGETKGVTKPAESKPFRRDWWADDEVEPPKAAQKETLDLNSLDLPMEQNKVLLRLSRSKLTIYGLRWAIDADSKRRNLPWRLLVSPPMSTPAPSSSPSSSSYSPIQPLAYSKQTVKYSQWNSAPNQTSRTRNVSWIDHYTSQPQSTIESSEPSASTSASPDSSGYERHPPSSTPEEASYFSSFKYPSQSWTEQDKSWLDAYEANEDEDGDGWENKGSPGKHDAKHQGFGAFVVSFADVHEARRFAREWHKRKVWDHRTERWITVDATWLW